MSTRKQARDTIQTSADLDLNPETVKDLEPPNHGPSVRGGGRTSSTGGSLVGPASGGV